MIKALRTKLENIEAEIEELTILFYSFKINRDGYDNRLRFLKSELDIVKKDIKDYERQN